VRCGACGRVYTAEPGRARAGHRAPKKSGLSLAIFLGGAALAAVLFFALGRREPAAPSGPAPTALEDQPGASAADPAAAARAPDGTRGWDAPPVLAARKLFEAAAAGDAARLSALRAPGIPALEAERGGERLADWKPFDGEVLSASAAEAAVRLSAAGSAPGMASETRLFEVRLVLEGGAWKVAGWERWQTPEERERAAELERAAALAAGETRAPVPKPRLLADGTLIHELEPQPVPFPDSTPEELRARITATYARLIDFGLHPMDNRQALDELVAIGAPALPALLTGLHDLPHETDEDAVRINMVNECLEEITGATTGFNPKDARRSAIRGWFGWWHLNGATFTGRPPAAEESLDEFFESEPSPPRR
jgi:hypothetical protein